LLPVIALGDDDAQSKYVPPAGIEALLALVPGVDAYFVVGIKFEPCA
jgi:hypothetical protein